MPSNLIGFLWKALFFFAIAAGGFWICDRAKAPIIAFWIWGLLMLTLLLSYSSGYPFPAFR